MWKQSTTTGGGLGAEPVGNAGRVTALYLPKQASSADRVAEPDGVRSRGEAHGQGLGDPWYAVTPEVP